MKNLSIKALTMMILSIMTVIIIKCCITIRNAALVKMINVIVHKV